MCGKGERDSKGKFKHSGPRTEMDKVVPMRTKSAETINGNPISSPVMV